MSEIECIVNSECLVEGKLLTDALVEHTSEKSVADQLINNVVYVTALGSQRQQLRYEVQAGLSRLLNTAIATTIECLNYKNILGR